MKKDDVFLLLNGAVVGVGLIFFLRWYFHREESGFRDDHWLRGGKRPPRKPGGASLRLEQKIDQKILLDYRPEPGAEESKPEFRSPNFHGKPHEVLGIPSQSDPATINAAFRHWMKRYHPDRVTHLGPEYVEQARRRAEQLNTARAALLREQG